MSFVYLEFIINEIHGGETFTVNYKALDVWF